MNFIAKELQDLNSFPTRFCDRPAPCSTTLSSLGTTAFGLACQEGDSVVLWGRMHGGHACVDYEGHLKSRGMNRGMNDFMSQNVLIKWFQEVNPPTKSSTHCLLLLIKTKSWRICKDKLTDVCGN